MTPVFQEKDRRGVWVVAHLICCGGAVLLLLIGGAGLTGAAIVRASFWLLVAGFMVLAAGVYWRARRRSHGDTRRTDAAGHSS